MDNVTSAAKLAGVARSTCYEHRESDPEFAAAWDDAVEQATDGLEVFSHRMSTTGLEVTETRRTVKRQLVGDKLVVVEETEVAITNRMVSPQMAMFLLRAHRPSKYVATQRVEHGGVGGSPAVQHEIYRAPDPVRALELARLTLELAPGPPPDPLPEDEHPVIEGNGTSRAA